MESYSGQLGGEEQPLDLTLKVKQQQSSEDEPRPNQQEKPLCLIKSCVCNLSHRHEVPPHSQYMPYPSPHHPHGHPHPHHHHHHPHHHHPHYHTGMMTGDMLAANNRTPPPTRVGSYPYPSPYKVPVESRYDSQGLSPLGHHLSLPGFARGFRQEQQRQHMEVPAAVDAFRSRSAPAPGCGIFPEVAPLREREEEHMDTEAAGVDSASQAAAPPPAPFSRYAESQGMGGSQRLSPALQQQSQQALSTQQRAVSPYDVVSSSRGRPNPSPRASPGFYGNNVDGGDVVVSSNAGPDVDFGLHSPAGSCGGSSSDLTADSSSAQASLAASSGPRQRPHPRSTSFHIRNIISVVDDGHSTTRIISRSSAAPPPDEQGPPSTTSTPPPSFQESRPQGAESSDELESPVGESEDGKENLGDASVAPPSGDPGVTHMTALDYLISKVLVERIDVPYKPCNSEIKQIFTGQRKGRLRLVDLIELQVEKSLQA